MYMQVCMCTHTHTRAHTHTHSYTHIPTHTHAHTYTLIHTHAHTHTRAHTHTHSYTHIHTHTHTHAHTHKCICMYAQCLYYNPYSRAIPLAGRLCEHVETDQSASVAENCNSKLQEYLDTLDVRCEGNNNDAAILTWTPNDDTPDVVYYQVVGHTILYHMMIYYRV